MDGIGITLKRGIGSVTFAKVADSFAVRMKSGRARRGQTLSAASAKALPELTHLMTLPERMDLFSMQDAKKLNATMTDLRATPDVDVVSHVYRLDDSPASTVVPTGSVTLQFRPDTADKVREQLFAEFGLELIEDLPFLAHGYTARLTRMSRDNPLKMCAKLQQRPELLSAEPDLAFRAMLNYVPSDTKYREQWHLNNRGDLMGLQVGADVKAELAWEISRGSRDIAICVMDDGFDLGHPDFSAPGKVIAPRDFGQQDVTPEPVESDDNHGTACAGVALAEETGVGSVGLAPRCAFMPLRMSLNLSDEAVVSMFRHALDNKADVISCSWSAASWNFPLSTKINAILHHCATQGRRNGKGCAILFAAGNENRPLNGTKDGRVSHQGFALHPDVIAVGASNSQDLRAGYSNFGPELACCAPSSGSGGRGVVTTDRRGAAGYESTDYTHSFGGTSSATPLSAGLAGLLLSVNPDLTAAEVKRILMDSADKIGAADDQYDSNGRSPLYGSGRINAARALQMAAGVAPPPQAATETLTMEHRVNKPIPDMQTIEDGIHFPMAALIKEIEISLDIRHSYIGDLKVSLITPGAKEILLHDRAGGGTDNLNISLRSTQEPQLFAACLGQSALGAWKLKIADTAQDDAGVLVKWGMAVSY